MIFGSQQQEQQIKDYLGQCFSEKDFDDDDGIVLEQWNEKLEEFFQLNDNNSTVPNNTKINIKEIPLITATERGIDSNPITTIYTEEDLRNELLKSYDKNICPSTISYVQANIVFHKILNVDLLDGLVSMLVWFRLRWNDPHFTWDPKDWNGIKVVYLQQEEFWDPDIEIWNSMDSIEKLFQSQAAYVDYNGNLFWSRMGQIQISCDVKGLFKFPTYTSKCPLEVGSWAYDSSKVNMDFSGSGYEIATSKISSKRRQKFQYNVKDNVRVELIDYPPFESYPQIRSSWSTVLYTVEIHQNLELDMVGVVVAKGFLTLISFGAFWLPPSSGERIAFTVTIPMVIELVKFRQVESSTMFSFVCFLFSLFVIFESIYTATLWRRTDPYWLSWKMYQEKRKIDLRENTYWVDVLKAIDIEMNSLQNSYQKESQKSWRELQILISRLMGFIRKPFSQNQQQYNNLELTQQELGKSQRRSSLQDSDMQNMSYLNSVCSQTSHDVQETIEVTQHLQPQQQEILEDVSNTSTTENLIKFFFQNTQQAQDFLDQVLDNKQYEYARKSYKRLCQIYSEQQVKRELFRTMGIVDGEVTDFAQFAKNKYNKQWRSLSNKIDRVCFFTIVPSFSVYALVTVLQAL